MLRLRLEPGSALAGEAEACRERLRELDFAAGGETELVLNFSSRVELCFAGPEELVRLFPKPFFLDFTRERVLQRLSHSSRAAEPLCRAVLGKHKHPLVYDATAGLGRDALILQAAGGRVRMFERSPVVWELLHDALRRAASSDRVRALLPLGLPELQPCGSLTEQLPGEVPDVIYYDPMFPPRHKSALVKKELRMLHYIVGADEDAGAYLPELLQLARYRVVVKRPAGAPQLEGAGVRVSGSAGGRICRFDIYPASGGTKAVVPHSQDL